MRGPYNVCDAGELDLASYLFDEYPEVLPKERQLPVSSSFQGNDYVEDTYERWTPEINTFVQRVH